MLLRFVLMKLPLLSVLPRICAITVGMLVATVSIARAEEAVSPKWISLFNGHDLTGWTVKVAKHPMGENYADTFRVEDGVIKVAYDKYGKFDQQFAHLYSNLPYS